jgi:hypothetical protein
LFVDLVSKSAVVCLGVRQVFGSGPGGQGKTALAGKIAGDWAAAGAALAVWSAREGGGAWDIFWLEQAREAGEAAVATATAGIDDERARAEGLLRLLLRRHGGRLLVFLDNLETIQDRRTLEFTDDRVAAFVAAARDPAAAGSGLRLLITSPTARPAGRKTPTCRSIRSPTAISCNWPWPAAPGRLSGDPAGRNASTASSTATPAGWASSPRRWR